MRKPFQKRAFPGGQGVPHGFSISELLFAIGIVVVLAALCFPVLGKSRQWINQSKCQNNLRNIGALIALYTADNNGLLPGPSPAGLFASYTRSNLRDRRNLCHFFLPYVDPDNQAAEKKLMSLFVCPAALELMEAQERIDPRCYGTSGTRKGGVEIMATPFGKRDGNSANAHQWVQPVKLQTLSNPAEIIAIMDRAEPSSTSSKTAHLHSRNFLFFDGHVRRVPLDKIKSATEILD